MWTMLKPNHATAFAALGLCLAAVLGYQYLTTILVIPGLLVAIITLYVFSTTLGSLLKNKCAHKGAIANIICSEIVVFTSLISCIIFAGFSNALVSHYLQKNQQETGLERMAETMNFSYSDVVQVEQNIHLVSYIVNPLVNVLIVGTLPTLFFGVLLGITNMKYSHDDS